MTTMIAIPSFFLGAALGVSDMPAALMIFLAIIIHKGTAAFALALKMVRSTMTRKQSLLLFSCFCCSTPPGHPGWAGMCIRLSPARRPGRSRA